MIRRKVIAPQERANQNAVTVKRKPCRGSQGARGPDSKARRAALTARLMSFLSLSGTRAMTDASAGLNTSNSFPDAAGDYSPSSNFDSVFSTRRHTGTDPCFGVAGTISVTSA